MTPAFKYVEPAKFGVREEIDMAIYPHREQTLDQLIGDPIVRLVMEADNVNERDLRKLFTPIAWKISSDRSLTGGTPAMAASGEGEGAQYRRGVGIMLLNQQNDVFVGRRMGGNDTTWQMPQGGINPDETPRVAAFRELKEEIGT